MCFAINYLYQDKRIIHYFPQPYAELPVKKRDGSLILLPWGRRQHQAGNLPLGGWAWLDSIEAGKWDGFFPRPVKLAVQCFMERDIEDKGHWFEIVKGQCIQGLVARYDQEVRVYVVSQAIKGEEAIFPRWPRILFG